jgi:hypothetical protein
MSTEENDLFEYTVLPGFSWFRIDIPVLRKEKFQEMVNLFEKSFFFTQVINNENCSFSTVVFGRNNLSARLGELDVLAENCILTILRITTPEEYKCEINHLLVASLFHIEPFLMWKNENRRLSLISVSRVIFNVTRLRQHNFED